MVVTHERGRRDSLWRWRRVGGCGLQEGHAGGKQQLAATVLTEQNRQENAGCAALIKGRGHPLEHRVHLDGTHKSSQ